MQLENLQAKQMEAPASQSDRSFVSRWMLVNIVGLPVLLIPSKIGFFIIAGLAVVSDGVGSNALGYAAMGIVLVVLAFTGAIIGTWLGFLQWLVLRRRVPQSAGWIIATAAGAALGAPLGTLFYAFLFVVFVDRPDGAYFSFAYEYLAFGPVLGLAISILQGSQLRKWTKNTKWWIVGWPVLITTGMLFANINQTTGLFILPIHAMIQKLKLLFPAIDNIVVFFIFDVVTSIMALMAVSLLTGILLDRLLISHTDQVIPPSN